MSFTYNLPHTTTIDIIRSVIPDTDAANFRFQDEELQGFLTLWGGDVRLAAAQALETLSALLATQAIRYTVDGFTMDRTQVPKALMDRAKALRENELSVPWELESSVDDYTDHAGRDWSNYIDTGNP